MNAPSTILIRLSSAVLTKRGIYQKLGDAIRQLSVAKHRVVVVMGADSRLLDFARLELIDSGPAGKLSRTVVQSARSFATDLLLGSLRKAGVRADIQLLRQMDSMTSLVESCQAKWSEQPYPSRPQLILPFSSDEYSLDELAMLIGQKLGAVELLLLAPTPGVMTIDPYLHQKITPRSCNQSIRQLPLYVLSKLHAVEPSFPKPAVVKESLSRGIGVRICDVRGIAKSCEGTVICGSHERQLETPVFTSGRKTERRLFLSAVDSSQVLLDSVKSIPPSSYVREYSIAWEQGQLTVSIAAADANDLEVIYPLVHADESILFWRHESPQRAAVLYLTGYECEMSLIKEVITRLADAHVNLLSLSTTVDSVSFTVTPEDLLVTATEIETAFGTKWQHRPVRRTGLRIAENRARARFGTFREFTCEDRPGQLSECMSKCDGPIFWMRESSLGKKECRVEIAFDSASSPNGAYVTLPVQSPETLLLLIRFLHEENCRSKRIDRWHVSVNREQVEIVIRSTLQLDELVLRLGKLSGGDIEL